MGNSCECVRRQRNDEAEDALLGSLVGEGTDGRPRGPPPPYQPQAPVYNYAIAAMSEERRAQLVQRITIIQSLPCMHYELRSDKEKKKEPRECAICMMDYSAGDPIRLLPCMHYYHLHCVDDWLMRSLTCPMCMERVDVGLLTTVHSGTRGSGGGGRRGFSLRRRLRQRQQAGQRSGSGLEAGDISSHSSSQSSSTSSSTEQLISPGPQFPWQQPPLPHSPRLQRGSSQAPCPGPGHFFSPIPLPPSNLQTPLQNITGPHPVSTPGQGPILQVVTPPPSSSAVVVVHTSPPTSPLLPGVN